MSLERTCYIHAGTHKTASSYIQSRLLQNRSLLASQHLSYEFPGLPKLKHKPLVHAANQGRWRYWNGYLKRFRGLDNNLLLSAEQFTLTLCDEKRLGNIIQILSDHGFSLHVVIFVRPQLDYMNSRYAYGLRCLHYSISFEDYVSDCLSRGSRDIYNYWEVYQPLFRADVSCTFLPFHPRYGDPFLQLADALALAGNLKYVPAAPGRANVQHGARGVWLSRLVAQKLEALGYNGHHLKKTSKVMRRMAERQGWHEERYFGFSDDLAVITCNHYRSGNDAFARRVWNCSWQDVFPQESKRQCVYTPLSQEEQSGMHSLADEAIAELASRNEKLALAIGMPA